MLEKKYGQTKNIKIVRTIVCDVILETASDILFPPPKIDDQAKTKETSPEESPNSLLPTSLYCHDEPDRKTPTTSTDIDINNENTEKKYSINSNLMYVKEAQIRRTEIQAPEINDVEFIPTSTMHDGALR